MSFILCCCWCFLSDAKNWLAFLSSHLYLHQHRLENKKRIFFFFFFFSLKFKFYFALKLQNKLQKKREKSKIGNLTPIFSLFLNRRDIYLLKIHPYIYLSLIYLFDDDLIAKWRQKIWEKIESSNSNFVSFSLTQNATHTQQNKNQKKFFF